MFTIFLVLITIVALLLIIVIMIQNPKGGGLDSSLGGSTSIGGVQNTNKFLDKSTWTLGAVLLLLILFSSLSFQGGYTNDSKVFDESTVVPQVTLPNAGASQENKNSQEATSQEPATQQATTNETPAN